MEQTFTTPTAASAPPAPELFAGWDARRIAGLAFVVNGLAQAVQAAALLVSPPRDFTTSTAVSIALNVAVGLSLVRRDRTAARWALLLAALTFLYGVALLGLSLLRDRLEMTLHLVWADRSVSAALAMFVASCFLGLLLGRAGKLRTVLALAAFSVYLLLEATTAAFVVVDRLHVVRVFNS